jgi:hypothetical protein
MFSSLFYTKSPQIVDTGLCILIKYSSFKLSNVLPNLGVVHVPSLASWKIRGGKYMYLHWLLGGTYKFYYLLYTETYVSER